MSEQATETRELVEGLVRAALEHSRTFGPMTAYGVRNFIVNHGGPDLSIGQVRHALGRMKDLRRGRSRVVRFADGSRSEPMTY